LVAVAAAAVAGFLTGAAVVLLDAAADFAGAVAGASCTSVEDTDFGCGICDAAAAARVRVDMASGV
jgi:hypothetical protein